MITQQPRSARQAPLYKMNFHFTPQKNNQKPKMGAEKLSMNIVVVGQVRSAKAIISVAKATPATSQLIALADKFSSDIDEDDGNHEQYEEEANEEMNNITPSVSQEESPLPEYTDLSPQNQTPQRNLAPSPCPQPSPEYTNLSPQYQKTYLAPLPRPQPSPEYIVPSPQNRVASLLNSQISSDFSNSVMKY
ncbi:hypothetical protein QTP88_023680 [Uroleucon formosanum]